MKTFGPAHLTTLAGLTFAIWALVATGRRLGGTSRRQFERGVAGAVVTFWVAFALWDAVSGQFSARSSLPLQLCDFVALAAAAAFVSHKRWLHSVAYFWGLALSTQALLTPDVAGGPGSLGFIAFFLYHAFVVGAGVYVVAVHGFRPSGRDLVVAIALGMAWAAATFALDLVTGWNYGYLGRNTPGRPTLIDYLGPWPQRALLMVMLGAGAMVLLWLPWLLFRRGRPRPT